MKWTFKFNPFEFAFSLLGIAFVYYGVKQTDYLAAFIGIVIGGFKFKQE